MANERPTRVAIVGGGCAAMAAAFELTRPEHRGAFEVTVYQLGWRLGGKGASGRGPAGRIEEHGLHVWMGWYENAFRLLRECYGELTGDPDAWQRAFTPASEIMVTERTADGGWEPWGRSFPPAPGLPGDAPSAAEPWTVRAYLRRTVALLRSLVEELVPAAADEERRATDRIARAARSPERAAAALASILEVGELATLAGITQAVALLDLLAGSFADLPSTLLVRFLDALGANAQRLLEARLTRHPELQRVWHVVDLGLATVRGQLRAGLLTDPRGFDALDEYDCREWLRLNGASDAALDCGYLRGLYDLGFGYQDGDPTKPRVAASQALRGFLRAFFTYRGAFFWKMNGGMGDVVFAPLYQVLRRRGVRFRFFHRLTNVRLGTDDTPHVAALDFDVQALVAGDAYEPLITVRGMPCWPSAPDWAQLVDGPRCRAEGWDLESHWERRRAGETTLEVGRDFDFVVLGVGLGAVPHVCGELLARDPRWREMVENLGTVATQAFQLWLDADMERLGWHRGPVTLSGFVEPFDTWADMGHLVAKEAWPRDPRAIAYFCSVLPDDHDDPHDPGYPVRRREEVRRNAVRFLDHHVQHLWPHAHARSGQFRWDLLLSPASGLGAYGETRFETQYWTANVNPSDRYTLSLPGTAKYRISPLDRTYDNLTICGDWTDCGFNSGCVEAAVMSGRVAAHALSLQPALEEIVGWDHP
jgi:uncharacterized protein with NAD-binding domain and iron-sulfur cluster